MRDFFDIHALAERPGFQGRVLAEAVHATFDRRRTPIPKTLPLARNCGLVLLSSMMARLALGSLAPMT
jgi:hypothetical protein